MANPEHLKILKEGVNAWFDWRVKNPGIIPDLRGAVLGPAYLRRWNLRGANLAEADLHTADLYAADLGGADLGGVDLTEADLHDANLSGAILTAGKFNGACLDGAVLREADLTAASFIEADLIEANLRGANLRGADLRGADVSGANLDNADLTCARAGFTVFADNDLSTLKGLETVEHGGPSTIGIDTIYKSKANIPEVFLRGAGVPEDFITYVKTLVGKAVDFNSCFVGYSTKDGDFAHRLYADLQAKNVRCWRFDENAKWGEPVRGEIGAALPYYDKLVVICSRHSLRSAAVIHEIERALKKEDREHKNVLFPLYIDNYLFDEWDHPRKADVVSRVRGDFRGLDESASYSKALSGFLDALNRPPQSSGIG